MLEDKNTQKTSLAELGEFGLINHITKYFKVRKYAVITMIYFMTLNGGRF